jgi:hypothetical protein
MRALLLPQLVNFTAETGLEFNTRTPGPQGSNLHSLPFKANSLRTRRR